MEEPVKRVQVLLIRGDYEYNLCPRANGSKTRRLRELERVV
jgi:hypothetical protein